MYVFCNDLSDQNYIVHIFGRFMMFLCILRFRLDGKSFLLFGLLLFTVNMVATSQNLLAILSVGCLMATFKFNFAEQFSETCYIMHQV